jgi:hypothetical protein
MSAKRKKKRLHKPVVVNMDCFSVEVKENKEGVIIDVWVRHGDLIDTHTYWNMDFFKEQK